MSIVHVTPGSLDIRAITTFGLTAKPNSTAPIGKFGTGLKYAIAVLVRLGGSVRLFVDEVEYEFYVRPGLFRGTGYDQVMMRKRKGLLKRWNYEELPFTADHGKHWEAWQAFREIESNTRDEGGYTEVYDNFDPESGTTVFIIDCKEYVDAYYDRARTFLPNSLTQREGDDKVQVFNEPSKHLYWRGIRVYDLDKPSIYTYNILDNIDLTEDRTVKYMFQVYQHLAGYIARSKDHKLINTVVSAKEEHFEAKLDFDYAYESPSQEFLEVIRKKKSRGGYVGSRSLSFYSKYEVKEPPTETTKTRIEQWAYDESLPEELQELLKHLLRCEIVEPDNIDPTDIF